MMAAAVVNPRMGLWTFRSSSFVGNFVENSIKAFVNQRDSMAACHELNARNDKVSEKDALNLRHNYCSLSGRPSASVITP